MSIVSKLVKQSIKKFFNIKTLERVSHVVIWNQIIKKKKPRITASISGRIKEEQWDEKVRVKAWEHIPSILNQNEEILYLEFGTWTGRSIKYFADKYKNKNSEFYGFDTFTGMPTTWRWLEKGHYNTGGKFPQINDNRVKFVKGLFQETLPGFLKNLSDNSKKKTVVIYFDAVLYSATLFTLFELNKHFQNYYFIFDQFSTDECRAFHNFSEANLKDYDLILACEYENAPEVVFGKFKDNK